MVTLDHYYYRAIDFICHGHLVLSPCAKHSYTIVSMDVTPIGSSNLNSRRGERSNFSVRFSQISDFSHFKITKIKLFFKIHL